MKKIKLKDFVLLLSRDESYLVKAGERKLHTQSGILDLSVLLEKSFGEKVKTHLGKEFFLVKPTLVDFMRKKLKRVPQVILPKDASIILAYTGIGEIALVVDAGTGSGFLAIFLAYYIPVSYTHLTLPTKA